MEKEPGKRSREIGHAIFGVMILGSISAAFGFSLEAIEHPNEQYIPTSRGVEIVTATPIPLSPTPTATLERQPIINGQHRIISFTPSQIK